MTIMLRPKLSILCWLILTVHFAAGCGNSTRGSKPTSEVVGYTAQDSEFAVPIYESFSSETGINVLPKYDVESTKTVGLVNEIIAEAKQPRCDVFWNNEILNTLRLEKLGLLEPYKSPAAEPFDSQWKSPDGMWHGFGARARAARQQESSERRRTSNIHQ